MHENALVCDVVNRINQLANAAKASRIVSAKVWLGACKPSIGRARSRTFRHRCAGSLASEAALEIEISDDPHDPNAQYVRLETIEVE